MLYLIPTWHLKASEAMMVVASKETGTVLNYLRGNRIDAGYKNGQQVNEDDHALQLSFRGQTADTVVPKEVYGIPFNVLSFPIHEHGKVG